MRRHIAQSQTATHSTTPLHHEVTVHPESAAGGRGGPSAHQGLEPNEKGPRAKRGMSPKRSPVGVPPVTGGPPSPMRKGSHALAAAAHVSSAGPEGNAGGDSWLKLGERAPLIGSGREGTAQEQQQQQSRAQRPPKPPSPRRGAVSRPTKADASLGQAVKLARRPWVLLALFPAVALWLGVSAFILSNSQRSQVRARPLF